MERNSKFFYALVMAAAGSLAFSACLPKTSETPVEVAPSISAVTDAPEAAATSTTSEIFVERDAVYGVYLSLSESDSASCSFGDASGCQIYYVEVALQNGEFHPDPASTKTDFYTGSGFQLALSPNQAMLAFKGVSASNQPDGVNVLDLKTGGLLQIDHSGSWPAWVNDDQLLFTTGPVRGQGQTAFKDFMIASIGGDGFSVEPAFGTADGSHGDWSACNFEDGFALGDWLAFHSETSSDPATFGCPLVDYVPTSQRGLEYGPQPVVISLVSSADADTAVKGVDYFQFDLAGAGINACAHFSGHAGYLICTEQNTQAEPYRVCSKPESSLQNCRSDGGFIILYNRLFGWALDESTQEFVSIRGGEPLFEHLHPAQLPGVESYWDMSVEGCQVYKTKQASLINNVVLANVYCQTQGDPNGRAGAETHNTVFSRIFLIDIADPAKPKYFDLTGWFEDQFDNWSDGGASGYTGVLVDVQP